VVAFVGNRIAAPQLRDDIEGFVEHGSSSWMIDLLPHAVELVDALTRTNTEDQPATRQSVNGHGLPGELVGTTAWHRCHGGTDLDSVSRRGDRPKRNPGIDHRVLKPTDVVPDEESIPAGTLSISGEVHHGDWVAPCAEVRQIKAVLHVAPACSTSP
jgi:hypothetical protein